MKDRVIEQEKNESLIRKNSEGKSNDSIIATTLPLLCLNSVKNFVLLPFAIVKFVCGNISGICRVLLDNCLQANLISDVFVPKFKLPIYSVHVNLNIAVNSVKESLEF